MPRKTKLPGDNGVATLPAEVFSGAESLPAERCLDILRIMVRARVMEERMIKMSKSGEGYFWIGGPGEEAFNTCLGLQVHKGFGGDGITIVCGGDAGTAEGDFASCMIWSTRPGNELPVLMIVMNNAWGISTAAATQHGEKHVADRGTAFGISSEAVD